MKNPRVSPPKHQNRRPLQEIPANTLHNHLSQKARKTVSKKLLEEEAKCAWKLSPSRNSSNVARGLHFSEEDVQMTPERELQLS